MREYSIAAIPADGIGPEVISAGVRVLQSLQSRMLDVKFNIDTLDWGSVTSWVYLFFAGFVFTTGAAGSLTTWRLGGSASESQPALTPERPAG